MLSLPINKNTFKRSFLDGDGNLEISTDEDAWRVLYEAGQPFSKDVQDLVDLKFSADTSKDLQFGQKARLTLTVSFSSEVAGRIDLIWPDDDSELIKKYRLKPYFTPNNLYMAIIFDAKAEAGVDGGFPVGPLSANFGVHTGVNFGYARLVPYPQSAPVRQIIGDLFDGIRLPQNIDAPKEIPVEGEVLRVNYRGYLNLKAALNWGYSLTGTRSFELTDLKLELDYALRVMAGLSFGYRLAGDFSIDCLCGALNNWVRFVVSKNQRSEHKFAADFGFTAKADLNGLPESADEFLETLFGTDAKTTLGFLAKAEKYSSVEELEKAVGKLSKGFLRDLSNKLIGKALANSTLEEFLAVVKKINDSYNDIDDRMVALYEDYLDRIPQLDSTLDRILGLSSFEGLRNITDKETWSLIQRLWGERFYDLLLSNDEFNKFLNYARNVKGFLNDSTTEHIRVFIAESKRSFPLNHLFKELEKYSTPEKLKTLVDEKLQGLVERLVGKTFDQLGDFKKASHELNAALRQVSSFKKKWYEKLTDAVHQSFQFNLHYAYTKNTEDEALLDVEINLAEPVGVRLAGAAAAGDFAEILTSYDPNLVRINRGVLTHKLSSSAHLQINVFGWGYKRLSEFLQNVEHAIESEMGGLLHVFTIETQIKQLAQKTDRKKLIESVQSSFLLRAVGETFQPIGTPPEDPSTGQYIINTLTNMAVQYEMLYRDDKTDAVELTEYLDLASFLGLVLNRELFIKELNSQFPDGLGKVTVDYVIRYDNQAVRNAFTLSGEELAEWARRAARQVIGAVYTGRKQTNWLARVGFAYQSPVFQKLYYEKGFTAVLSEGKGVTLPGWFTSGPSQNVSLDPHLRQVVVALFDIEREYVKRLVALDELVDKSIKNKEPISLVTLQKAAADFVSYADKLNDFGRENSFFAMFDKLVQEGSSNKWRRQSAIILNIEPPGGEPVVKYLMA